MGEVDRRRQSYQSGTTVSQKTLLGDIGERRLLTEQIVVLQSLLDAIPAPVFFKDKSLSYVGCNQALLEFVGKGRSELVGRSVGDLVDESRAEQLRRADAVILSGGEPQICDSVFTRADGCDRTIRIYKAAFRDASGEISGIIGVMTDLTELKNVDARLDEARQFMDTVISSAGAGVVVYDRELRHLLWNSFMEKLTGLSPDQVLGRHAPDLFPHLRSPEIVAIFNQVLAGETITVEDVSYSVPQTGFSGWVSSQYTPHKDAKGEIIGVIGLVRDVTERKLAEESLRENERKYRTLFENSPEGLVMMTDVFLDCNDVLCKMFGCSREDIIGHSPIDFSPERQPDGRASSEASAKHVAAALCGTPQFFSWQHNRRDGVTIDVEISLNAVDIKGRRILQAIIRDVTDRKRAESEVRETTALLRGVFDGITDPILLLKPDLEIVRLNQAAEKMLGAPSERAIGKKCFHVKGKESPCTGCSVRTSIGTAARASAEIYDAESDSWLETNSYPITDEAGQLVMIVEHVRDISEKKSHQAQLHQMAHYDPLSGLPNRFLFSERLRNGLTEARNRGGRLAVLFLDVDGFKLVNDSLGHNAGDVLIKQIATRLRATMREADVVARMGGDEFTVMLPCIRNNPDAAKVARKILSALSEPFTVGGVEHFISASIGISVYPGDGEDAESLVKNADTAMYGAKERGRNTYHLYTEEMNIAAVERMTLGNSLRHALEREEFVLHYQPRVDLLSGDTLGSEALLRWRRPGIGLVYPDKFIPTAEETGLISSMGEWVLREACAQNMEWQRQGMRHIQVAVNISARQFQRRNLPSLVRRVLGETGLESRWLDLELTESILMQDPELTAAQLSRLKNMGVSLSIDDFGTGYSSLSYLQKFPVDAVKIDKSFIRDITTNPESAAITKAIVAMADSLHLRVIAEGVETLAQVDTLKELGCREIQGYFISRPVPQAEFSQILRGSNDWLRAA